MAYFVASWKPNKVSLSYNPCHLSVIRIRVGELTVGKESDRSEIQWDWRNTESHSCATEGNNVN